jgi:site-specific DNA-methyltransferase (adenine-specific)
MTDKLMMVIPSRWFIKNALRKFRYDMFNTFNLKYIIHYDNNKYFPNADIKGGICYFLSDKTYIGLTNVNQTNLDLTKFEILPTIIDENVFNLTKKLDSYKNIQDLFRSKNSFGIKTNDKRLSNTGAVKCSTSLSNGLFKFIPTDVVKSHDELAKYKIAIPCAYGKGGSEEKTFYTRIVELKPNEVCNESFVYFSFSNQTEANSFKSYIQTTFVKFLVKLRKIKQDITTDVFKWVPIVPLDREWTDEQLFDYFNLTQEERQLILENKI